MARPRKGWIERMMSSGAEAPVGPEVGTTVDPQRLFIGHEHGEVLSLDVTPDVPELEAMILHDGQARQLASSIRLPIRTAAWSIEKGPNDKGEAQFVRDVLARPPYEGGMTTSFDLVLSQIAYAVVTRRAFFEKVWKINDEGKAVYHKLAWRPAATCEIRADKINGSFNGFIQRGLRDNKQFTAEFGPSKAFVYVHNADIAPLTGATAFETAYRDHLQKLKVKYLYFSFLENVAYPKLKAQYTGNEKGGLRNLVRKAVSLGRGSVVGIGDREEITVLESQRTSQEYINALNYLDTQMSKSFLSTFLDLGTKGDAGSYALSKDQSGFFFNALEAVNIEIAQAVNNYLVPDLVFYNFGASASYPEFRFSPLHDEAKEAAMRTFETLQMAANPRISQNFYQELVMKVSNILGLDSDKVIEDIDTVYKPQESPSIVTPQGTPTAPGGGPLVNPTTGSVDTTKTPGYVPRTNQSNRGRPTKEEVAARGQF